MAESYHSTQAYKFCYKSGAQLYLLSLETVKDIICYRMGNDEWILYQQVDHSVDLPPVVSGFYYLVLLMLSLGGFLFVSLSLAIVSTLRFITLKFITLRFVHLSLFVKNGLGNFFGSILIVEHFFSDYFYLVLELLSIL